MGLQEPFEFCSPRLPIADDTRSQPGCRVSIHQGAAFPVGPTPPSTRAHRPWGLKKITYSSCGWPASRAGRWGGAARAQGSRSDPEVDSPGGGPPCEARDTRQSAHGIQMSGRAGRLQGRAIPGHLLIQRQTQAPKSLRWNHRSNIRESQGGSLPASFWCDSNEAVSYTVVFNLLKEYIMTY